MPCRPPATPPQQSRLLTPDDVAVMLGLTRVSVIRQSRAGKLPAIHIGKCYRYRLESLQAWLDKQERAA
jgi:excisionase family DNA binding protein